MYVLHHADKPSLYHGLPDNPQISTTVKLWKSMLKPIAAFGIAAAAFTGWLHYITIGPNRPEDDQEEVLNREGDILKDRGDA